MKRLWEYLTKLSQESNEMPSMIAQLFSSKTIIPASDGMLYPLSRSKMLLRDSETSNVCNCCSVMNKLGYPHVDFSKIDTQPSILLKQLTSCFQKGEEIVQCFSQAPPKSDKLYSIELTDDEVVSFRSSLGKCHRRREVSRYLLQMPLYYTIDGKKTRIHKATQVFLLDQNISLPEGIPSDHNGKIVLKATDSKFYSRVIPKNQLKYVSPEQLYIQFVFPLLSKLEEKDIKAHVDYILSREQQMKEAFNELKRTAFIAHDGKCYTPHELYNPEIEFYRTFYPEYILQDEWKDKTEALKRLNLHSTVTMDEWLKCANDFAEEADEPEVAKKEMIEKKSKVLLDEVSKIIKHLNEGKELSQSKGKETSLKEFLSKAATIKFLCQPQQWELNMILSSVLPEEKHRTQFCMMKFEGSVSSKDADIACLYKPVLPKACLTLTTEHKEVLLVEVPTSPTTVARNLKCLCELINSLKFDKRQVLYDYASKLIPIFDKHYSSLSEEVPPKDICDELKGIKCIVSSDHGKYVHLLKPSQLVMQLPQLPPDCSSLFPYCFEIASSFQRHAKFLKAVGVKRQLEAQEWVKILLKIKQRAAIFDVYKHDKSKIKYVYTELIKCLRHKDTIDDMDIHLPDESFHLHKLTDLYFDDASWYNCLLPKDYELAKILSPPVDDMGQRTLPDCLPVKRLSKIVVEELHKSFESSESDFVCYDEQLYEAGKRSESGRCLFVQGILKTLKSDELFKGLCRVYHSDYSCLPTDEFKKTAKKLEQIHIRCYNTDLKLVLRRKNGEVIPSTEHSSKCHLCNNTLYIAPHNQSDTGFSTFYNSLATCIHHLFDYQIKNKLAIAAIFQCQPDKIPQVLTGLEIQVHEYDDNVVSLETFLPWKRFYPLEALILLNFHPSEAVRYISDDGLLLDAEIVKSEQGDLEPKTVIKVKGVNTKVIEKSTDAENSKQVSPLRLFKELDKEQKEYLLTGSSSSDALPIDLAYIPYEDPAALEEWLKTTKSLIVSNHSMLVQSILTLRLIAHLHYQLVMIKENQTELHNTYQKIQGLFCGVNNHDERVMGIMKLTHEMITICTSSDSTATLQPIFPSEAVGRIIERDNRKGKRTEQNIGEINEPISNSPSPGQSVRSYSSPIGSHPPVTAERQTISNSPGASDHCAAQRRRTYQSIETPQPNICMQSATAWLEQAKADYNSAICLLGSDAVLPSATTRVNECSFPALICFVCHDTVEKCIKGVYYAFCGLRQDLINCSNLVTLCNVLKSLPHHPTHLMEAIMECSMIVSKHETRSRFPYYKNPPCASASIYHTEDAKEAFQATSKLLHCLQSEEKFKEILKDLNELPAKRYMSVLLTMSDNQEYPHNWEHMEDTDQVKLFLLDPITEREEYERIINEFLLTLPRVKILKVERIQNKVLWKRYLNCSRNFQRPFLREELLFHGTGENQPDHIYRGGEGFNMQFCSSGMWGRGNYFAVNSSYANGYAFKMNGVKKMFAAWVLTGNSVYLPRDSNLTKPPLMNEPSTCNSSTSVQHHYDSVCGSTGGSRVYITYDNEHAYPAYLISYTDQL